MRCWNRLKSLFTVLSLITGLFGQAQLSDALKHRWADLEVRRQAGVLKDTDYCRAVDSIAPMLEADYSLPQLLSSYQEIAFGDPALHRQRAFYYTYLALNAYNTNKFGSAIYYSEKNNEERIKAGLFEKGDLAHSDLFALSLYYNNRDYAKVIIRLLSLAPILRGIPAAVTAGGTSPEQVFVALSILQTAVYTYAKTGDTAARDSAYTLAEEIQQNVRQHPEKYAASFRKYDYLRHNTAYRNELSLGHTGKVQDLIHIGRAEDLLHAAIRDVESPDFPARLKADYGVSLYTEAVEFYFDHNQVDSARRYLQILNGHGPNAAYAVTDPGFLLINDSRLLAHDGKYAEAWQALHKAWLLRDSAFYSVSSDRDNNLYALAEAGNARAELLRAEESKRAARQSNLFLLFILTLIVLGGLSAFLVYHARQQRRLLRLQGHLASNFHDTVGPMLLYANALVKKESERYSSEGLEQLKGQLGQIMEAVRGISHDLKSSRPGTISALGRDLNALLEKIREATGIAFTLTVENGNAILSRFQMTHLSKIVHELISNSIRHAACNNIVIVLKGVSRNLQIDYTDDGKGFDPSAEGGIGLQNINERTASLRGRFELNNNFPNGYTVALSIPLV